MDRAGRPAAVPVPVSVPVSIAVAGFMLFGPDSLLSGVGAIDVGSKEGALSAAGIITLPGIMTGQILAVDGGSVLH